MPVGATIVGRKAGELILPWVLAISQKTAEYQKIKAGQSRVQALYDRLLATMQTLDVNKEISPESVNIMEPFPLVFRYLGDGDIGRSWC